jgi:CRP-like cAMP-binding protein
LIGSQETFQNGLLRSLSGPDFALVLPGLTSVDLPVRFRLERHNHIIDNVYFFRSGLASMVTNAGSDHTIEVGMIGREGMSGLSLLLASDTAMCETFMQSPGDGWRMSSADLRSAMTKSSTLQRILIRFAHVMLSQTTYTALANGRYRLEERLARWLLMAHDRAEDATLSLTHEFLSVMLGVRRPGVTVALKMLGERGIIEAARGSVEIKDRPALEDMANGCYGAPEADYRRLIGEYIKPNNQLKV